MVTYIWGDCISQQGYNQWINDVVEQWKGSNSKQSYSYLIQRNSTASFTWAFQRSEEANTVRHNPTIPHPQYHSSSMTFQPLHSLQTLKHNNKVIIANCFSSLPRKALYFLVSAHYVWVHNCIFFIHIYCHTVVSVIVSPWYQTS